MKLYAVTICINYADYLECAVRNARHFDEWVVVTCKKDKRTQELCKKHGMKCVVSKLLKPDGRDFHAVHGKWNVINEGLEVVEKARNAACRPGEASWALVLDADVLLPRHFRERLEAMPLVPGTLYGAAGRKILDERVAFDQLKECEPWATLVARNSNVIGYFNLFSLDKGVKRYPSRKPGDKGGGHDDWRFTHSFDADHKAFLPMTVIHTGWPGVNWDGRKADSYEMRDAETRRLGDAERESLAPQVTSHKSPITTAAVIGYFPGNRWLEVVKGCAKVWLVDQFQVHAKSGDPVVEADRVVLRGLFEKETAGMSNLTLAGAHGVEELAAIQDDSLDLLYLPGEVAPDMLARILPYWRAKLKDGAVVCGDLYGHPYWPEATYSIALLLGTPDEVTPEGRWRKVMRAEDWKVACADAQPSTFNAQLGVALVNRTKENIAKLVLSLHSVRRHWAGPVAVLHWGDEDPSLTISCARLGAELWNVGEAPEEDEDDDDWLSMAAGMVPFEKALVLQPGMIAVSALDRVFSMAGSPLGLEPELMPLLVKGGRVSAANTDAIAVCAGSPDTWSDEKWQAWSETEAAAGVELAGVIATPLDAAIVSVVTPDEAPDFERAWLSWKFPPGTPVVLVLAGMRRSEFWLDANPVAPTVIELPAGAADDGKAVLDAVMNATDRRRLIFLPPTAMPMPGASLITGTVFVHHPTPAKQKNREISLPFFGSVEREAAGRVLEQSGAIVRGGICGVVFRAAEAGGGLPAVDMRRMGWQVTSWMRYTGGRVGV